MLRGVGKLPKDSRPGFSRPGQLVRLLNGCYIPGRQGPGDWKTGNPCHMGSHPYVTVGKLPKGWVGDTAGHMFLISGASPMKPMSKWYSVLCLSSAGLLLAACSGTG